MKRLIKYFSIVLIVMLLFTFQLSGANAVSVLQTLPALSGVPTDKVFSVTTTLPIDVNSINAQNCYCKETGSGTILKLNAKESVLLGAERYMTELRLDSGVYFKPSSEYKFIMTSEVKSISGENLDTGYEMSFTVAESSVVPGAESIKLGNAMIDFSGTSITGNPGDIVENYVLENDLNNILNRKTITHRYEVDTDATGEIVVTIPLSEFPEEPEDVLMMLYYEADGTEQERRYVCEIEEPIFEGDKAVFKIDLEKYLNANYKVADSEGTVSLSSKPAKTTMYSSFCSFYDYAMNENERFKLYFPKLEAGEVEFMRARMTTVLGLFDECYEHYQSKGYYPADNKMDKPMKVTIAYNIIDKITSSEPKAATYNMSGLSFKNGKGGSINIDYGEFLNMDLKTESGRNTLKSLIGHELFHGVQDCHYNMRWDLSNNWVDESMAAYYETVFMGNYGPVHKFSSEVLTGIFPDDVNNGTNNQGYGRYAVIDYLMQKTDGTFVKDMLRAYGEQDKSSKLNFAIAYKKAISGREDLKPVNMMFDFYKFLFENYNTVEHKLVEELYRGPGSATGIPENQYFYRIPSEKMLDIPTELREQIEFEFDRYDLNINTKKGRPMIVPVRIKPGDAYAQEGAYFKDEEYMKITLGTPNGQAALVEVSFADRKTRILTPDEGTENVYTIENIKDKLAVEKKRYIAFSTNNSEDSTLTLKQTVGRKPSMTGMYYEATQKTINKNIKYKDNSVFYGSIDKYFIYITENGTYPESFDCWIPILPMSFSGLGGGLAKLNVSRDPGTGHYKGSGFYPIKDMYEDETGELVWAFSVAINVDLSISKVDNMVYKDVDGTEKTKAVAYPIVGTINFDVYNAENGKYWGYKVYTVETKIEKMHNLYPANKWQDNYSEYYIHKNVE